MGQKVTKQKESRPYSKMNKDTKMKYYKAEFQCMGDVRKDGVLSEKEFIRLMTLLGLPEVTRAAPILFKKQTKRAGDKLSLEEYSSLMSDHAVDSKTNMWRQLFAQFDTDGSGWASKPDIVSGLGKLGIALNDQLKAKMAAMDCNKDGKIHYGDFLQMQLLHK